jgi:hypothetical protein
MSKMLVVSLLAVGALISGCATFPQTTATHSSNLRGLASSSTASRDTGGQSVWVDPPTGSHIGGGFVRVPGSAGRNDEAGLISAINSLDAAEQRRQEQPFVLAAAAQTSGLSQEQLLAQQNQTRLRMGELLALNILARNQTAKVNELAAHKSQGQSWSDLARANGIPLANLAQKVRDADAVTAKAFVRGEETGRQDVRNLNGTGVGGQGRSFGPQQQGGP